MSTWSKPSEYVVRYVETHDRLRGETRDEYIARLAEELNVDQWVVEQGLEVVESYEECAW